MGSDIAYVAALVSYDLMLYDVRKPRGGLARP